MKKIKMIFPFFVILMGIFYLTACIRKNAEPEIYMFNPKVDFSTVTFDIKVIEPEEILIKEIYLKLYKENELEETRSSKEGIHKVGVTEDIEFYLLSPATEYRIDFSFDYVVGSYMEEDVVMHSYSFKTLENTTGVFGEISNWSLINEVFEFDAIVQDDNKIIPEVYIYLKSEGEIVTILDKKSGINIGNNKDCRFEPLLPNRNYSVLLCVSFTYEDNLYKDLLLDEKTFKTNDFSFVPTAFFSNVNLKEDSLTFDFTINDDFNTLTKLLVLLKDSRDNIISSLTMDDGLMIGRNKNNCFNGLWPNTTYTLSVIVDYQTPLEKIRNEIIAEHKVKTTSFVTTPVASLSNLQTNGASVTFSYEVQDRYKMLTDLSIVLLTNQEKDLYSEDEVVMKLTKEDGVAVGNHEGKFQFLAPNTEYSIYIVANYHNGKEEIDKEILAVQTFRTKIYSYPTASIVHFASKNSNVTFYYWIQDQENILTDISIGLLDIEDNVVMELTKEDGVAVGNNQGEFNLLMPNTDYKIVIFGSYQMEKEIIKRALATQVFTTGDYPYLPTAAISNINQDEDSISFDYQLIDEYTFLTALKCNITSGDDEILKVVDLKNRMANSHYAITIDGIVNQTFKIQLVANYKYLNNEENNIILDSFVYLTNAKEDFEYNITDTGVVITKYIGKTKTCIIPQVIDGEEVKEISNYAFYKNDAIKRIIIPDGVKKIGQFAFSECKNLKSINIPNSVTSTGFEAFSRCSSLESIVIPESITDMGHQAFTRCSNLRYVYYEGTIKRWCELKCNVFETDWNREKTHHFYIRNSKNTWEEVTSLEIPSTLTEIDNYQFSGFDNLTSITIPNSVTSIGIHSFFGCRNITNIIIPNSVTNIDSNAFYNCANLESVTLPKSLTELGLYAFGSCIGLIDVYYEGTIEDWCRISIGEFSSSPMSYAEHFYIRNSSNNWEEVTSLEIPNTITRIGDYQFYNFQNVTFVAIPNTITSIGRYAFYDCTGLTSITIPDSVTSIGGSVFDHCGGIIINCEAASKPEGWNSKWLGGSEETITVNWGYRKEE